MYKQFQISAICKLRLKKPLAKFKKKIKLSVYQAVSSMRKAPDRMD
jgi:hypothetical protein